MKKTILLVSAIAAMGSMVFLSSCKKDKEEPKKCTIDGIAYDTQQLKEVFEVESCKEAQELWEELQKEIENAMNGIGDE